MFKYSFVNFKGARLTQGGDECTPPHSPSSWVLVVQSAVAKVPG